MKNSQNQKTIGKIKQPNGLKGHLYLLCFSGAADWSEGRTQLELWLGDKKYSTESFRVYKKGLVVKLSGIDDRNQAEAVQGQLVSISNDYLVSKPGEDIFLSEVEGFEVLESGQASLGHVTGFSSNGVQDLLLVDKGSMRTEIPMIEEFTEKIDFEGQKIHMNLPEGFTDFSYEI